ncbi:MAG: lipoprotein insertase outer membrane protein LolB [Candidatus Aminicenantales bacterium]
MKKHRDSASFAPGRAAGLLLLAGIMASCAGRPPVLVPPRAGVEAVEGYGSASVQGGETAVKGKFAFLFRRPDLGRVEAFDPLGRTIYYMIFRGDEAYFVVPSKKAYAEEKPETLMARLLGFSLRPDEIIPLLSGQWTAGEEQRGGDPAGGWTLSRDAEGRVVRGRGHDLSFEVKEFFPGAGVPRTVLFSRPGTSGRVKVLSARFNPAPRPEAFESSFLKTFTRKSWEDIQEMAGDGR